MDNQPEHVNNLVKMFGQEKRWVNWRLEKNKDGKNTKKPYQVSGVLASSTDPLTWSTYYEAVNASSNVGIIFTPDQKLLGIDIDHCLEDGKIVHAEKTNIEELLFEADTYVEISPSGTGLHIFFSLTESFKPEASRKHTLPYELYTSGRFFTVTQKVWGEEKEVRNITPDEVIALLGIIGYPWKKSEAGKVYEPSDLMTLDDASVLDKMFDSKNGNKIYALYNGEISIYNNDDSSADMALCSHLAFWTGRNASQINRIWSNSPLGQRSKTQDREDYRDRTIEKAVLGCKEIYTPHGIKTESETIKNVQKINIITFQDFSQLKLPTERWLIRDIIPKEGFITIASPSGEKKTWVALSMAGSIANGTDFLKNEEFKTIKGRVLYIDEEMSDTELQRRIKLLSLGETKDIILSRQNNLNFSDDKQVAELSDLIEKENIQAVFIDTFRSVAGGLKEDKAEDVRAYYDKFRPFKNKGVAIIFLDHCRKPNHFEGGIPKKEQLLGSQDKLASIEMLHMIKSEEISGDILFYTRKARNGKEFLPFRIEMKENWDEQCQTTKIELLYKGKLEEKETVVENAKKIIRTLLLSGKMKRKEILSILQAEHHIGERNASDAIRLLENNKEVSHAKVGNENLYQLDQTPKNDNDFADFNNVAEIDDTS